MICCICGFRRAKAGRGMRWSREQKIGCAVVCGLGAMLGLFVGFILFSVAVRSGSGAAFAFWIMRPGLYWPWPTFGAAIAWLGLCAVWILRRPRQQAAIPITPATPEMDTTARVDVYHSLIARAVSQLPINDPANRQTVYDRARGILDEHPSKADLLPEQRALEAAIQKFERRAPRKVTFRNPFHRPTTISLLLSIYFLRGFWAIDCTCMSLYWVARLKRP